MVVCICTAARLCLSGIFKIYRPLLWHMWTCCCVVFVDFPCSVLEDFDCLVASGPVLLALLRQRGRLRCEKTRPPASQHRPCTVFPFQLKSVIRRTKESPNVHPMYREGTARRKMGPIIANKSNSQDRLIEELQGKLGIGRTEQSPRRKRPPDDWLTEGVIVVSNPQRKREEGGAHAAVAKVDWRGAHQEPCRVPVVFPFVLTSGFFCFFFCLLSSLCCPVSILPLDRSPARVSCPPEKNRPPSAVSPSPPKAAYRQGDPSATTSSPSDPS